jgi:regulator of cell morphogenesis and NO signaling
MIWLKNVFIIFGLINISKLEKGFGLFAGKFMYLEKQKLNRNLTISEIVNKDYRTADVFKKHGMEYCCGGNMPFFEACSLKGIDEKLIFHELEIAMADINTSNTINFSLWDTDFLIDYIVIVHHQYLKTALPLVKYYVDEFVANHQNKFSYLPDLKETIDQLAKTFVPTCSRKKKLFFLISASCIMRLAAKSLMYGYWYVR